MESKCNQLTYILSYKVLISLGYFDQIAKPNLAFFQVHLEPTQDVWMKSKCFFCSAFSYLWRSLCQIKLLDFYIAFCISALGDFLNTMFLIAVTLKSKHMIIVLCMYLLCLDPAIRFTVCVFHPESSLITRFQKPYSGVEEFTVQRLIVLVLEDIKYTNMIDSLKLVSWKFYS